MNRKYKDFISVSNHGGIEAYLVDTKEVNLKNWLMSCNAHSIIESFKIEGKFKYITILKSLNVDEENRGQGIGAGLLREPIEFSVQNKAEAIILQCDTGETNLFDLKKWYESFGFVSINEESYPIMMLVL